MRLSSLKLSGFKSFADSSTLNFKANRTAVVGPNGCGKSNVIDAIRWVMGESSARQLRGGSMQDVIFTGTAKRKPVGMASVELRFDNTYGQLGGMYNAYNELSVRRQVNRDGKSEYFLNGTKCRRRDITDIFLGTGLGPRSYAIIEQGMINRLVDAKPEDMRVYIEEAAGVSRYQSRRRETLSHLEHTTQNLARLDDIRLELSSQLKSLKRQAEAALHYKQLEASIRRLKIEVLSFQYGKSIQLQQEYTHEMNHLGDQFKLVRTELTRLEHDLTTTSELFQRLMQQSMPLQHNWQTAEHQLAELKSQLQHKQQLVSQNQDTLQQLQQQKLHSQERLQLIEIQLDTLFAQQQQYQTEHVDSEQAYAAVQQQCADLKAQRQHIQQQFYTVKTQVEQQQQKQLHMLSQIEQLNKNIERQQQHHDMLQGQVQALAQHDQQAEIVALAAEQHDLHVSLAQLSEKVTQTQSLLANLENSERDLQQQLQTLNNQIQLLQREQQQLTHALPKLSQTQATGQTLIQALQLADAAKPYVHLIEKFLSAWLNSQLQQDVAEFARDIPRQIKVSQIHPIQCAGLTSLSTWILQPQHSLWANVVLAESLSQALALQHQLQTGQSILTLDGYHVGSDWLIALDYEQSQASGLSQRLRLDEIEQELIHLNHELSQVKPRRVQNLNALSDAKVLLKQQNLQLKAVQEQLHQVTLDMVKQQTAVQAFALQQQQLQQQLVQLSAQLAEDEMQRDDLDIDLHALNIKLEHNQPEYKTLQFQFETCTAQLEEVEKQAIQTQQAAQLATRRCNELQQQIELLQKDASFLTQQQNQIHLQMQQAASFVDPLSTELPVLQVALNEQHSLATALQQQWQTWQQELNAVQAQQHDLTTARQQIQQQDEQLRQALEEKRLAWQAAKTDAAHYANQLTDMGAQAQPCDLALDIDAKQQTFEQAQQQFAKLAAVNLAASAEYEQVSARYDELKHQMQDLENTVEQLQAAMKSIDQETRKLFMDTFDRVNHELAVLFPKVFNGGEASLSLESDWQSGVKLMARPPGKRNSSLALLSGGEKALTALALVFAIFRLNPAPFCVLDEVDAPLDDANVGRFCNLVKELSEQVQFIYITHNKLAMTMATDLLGVTMPEPGASKLVTVNLEQAEEYSLVAES